MTDYELDKLIEPLTRIYNEIELDLIKKIAERLLTYDSIDGTLEFYIKKLDELGALNSESAEIISRYTNLSLSEVSHLLESAGFANVNMPALKGAYEAGMIANPAMLLQSEIVLKVINDSYKDLSGVLKLINTRAIEGARSAYMDVLNKAYIEVSSGITDYNTAIKQGLIDMARRGINGATYQRKDGTIVHYSLEGTVRRDILTATYQTANRGVIATAQAIGAEHVEVSSHLGARTGDGVNPWSNHAGWQGQVYKIEGSDEYDNLYERTGYGSVIGLGGVNCRHRMFPFIKGFSQPSAEKIDSLENLEAYELSQKQRKYERKIRALKRELEIAKIAGDDALINKYSTALDKTQKSYIEFVNKNRLIRQPEREQIL